MYSKFNDFLAAKANEDYSEDFGSSFSNVRGMVEELKAAEAEFAAFIYNVPGMHMDEYSHATDGGLVAKVDLHFPNQWASFKAAVDEKYAQHEKCKGSAHSAVHKTGDPSHGCFSITDTVDLEYAFDAFACEVVLFFHRKPFA